MLRIVIVALIVAAAGAACKGGASSDSVDPPVITEEAFRWSAQQAVNAVMITEDDLPANFDLVPADEDDEDDDQPVFAFIDECAEFNDEMNSEKVWLGSISDAESGDFENEGEDGFSSSASAFLDLAIAEGETQLFTRFMNTCEVQFEAEFQRWVASLGEEDGGEVTDVAVDLQELSVPAVGDWTEGVRVSVSFKTQGFDIAFKVDSVYVREGRLVGGVDYTYYSEPDEALRDGIIATIAGRLAAEDAKLPT